MASSDTIKAYGHINVLGTHKSTIEFTKETSLTLKGDCIIGVQADKACFDLNLDLKAEIKIGAKFRVILEVGNIQESFFGYGHRDLKLLDKNDIVFRTSNYICERTILINCSKACLQLNRDLIKKLKSGEQLIKITIEKTDV